MKTKSRRCDDDIKRQQLTPDEKAAHYYGLLEKVKGLLQQDAGCQQECVQCDGQCALFDHSLTGRP